MKFIVITLLAILNYSCTTYNPEQNIEFNKRKPVSSNQNDPFYGKEICNSDNNKFRCTSIYKKDTWKSLFKDKTLRKLVMNLNRTNMPLKHRKWLIIPKDLNLNIEEYSPFPKYIKKTNRKTIIISISKQAYGAYDRQGTLIRWGSANTGAENGEDNTPLGEFKVYRKKGANCKSSKYPLPKGGSPMPYCMFFHKGYAIHEYQMPGFPVSLGCVRVDKEDAKWLYKFSPMDTIVIVQK